MSSTAKIGAQIQSGAESPQSKVALMYRSSVKISLAAVLILVSSACAEKTATLEVSPTSNETGTSSLGSPPKAPAVGASTFQGVEQALQSGEYDTAAARLLEMRAVGKQFTEAEAAQYRQLLNEAYMQALEPAQKGDARAKAAIEMIRANPGR